MMDILTLMKHLSNYCVEYGNLPVAIVLEDGSLLSVESTGVMEATRKSDQEQKDFCFVASFQVQTEDVEEGEDDE